MNTRPPPPPIQTLLEYFISWIGFYKFKLNSAESDEILHYVASHPSLYFLLNSFLASIDFCRLLITMAPNHRLTIQSISNITNPSCIQLSSTEKFTNLYSKHCILIDFLSTEFVRYRKHIENTRPNFNEI